MNRGRYESLRRSGVVRGLLTAATFAGPAFGRSSGDAATPPKTSGFGSLGPVTLNSPSNAGDASSCG